MIERLLFHCIYTCMYIIYTTKVYYLNMSIYVDGLFTHKHNFYNFAAQNLEHVFQTLLSDNAELKQKLEASEKESATFQLQIRCSPFHENQKMKPCKRKQKVSISFQIAYYHKHGNFHLIKFKPQIVICNCTLLHNTSH